MARKRQKKIADDSTAPPPRVDALSLLPLELWHTILCEYLPVEPYHAHSDEFLFKIAQLRCVCRAFAQLVDMLAPHVLTRATKPPRECTLPYTAIAFDGRLPMATTTATTTCTQALPWPPWERITAFYNACPRDVALTEPSAAAWSRVRDIQFCPAAYASASTIPDAIQKLDCKNLRSLRTFYPLRMPHLTRLRIDRFEKLETLEIYRDITDRAHDDTDDNTAINYLAQQSHKWPSTIRAFTLQTHRGDFRGTRCVDSVAWSQPFRERLQKLNLAFEMRFPLNHCTSLRKLTLTSTNGLPWSLVDVTLPRLRALNLCGEFDFKDNDIGAFAPNLSSLTFYFACDDLYPYNVHRITAQVESISRLLSLEHIDLDVPFRIEREFARTCKIRSMRVSFSNCSTLQPVLDGLPNSIEELDMSACYVSDGTSRDSDTLSLAHLTRMHRLIVRDSIHLKKYRALRVPDSLRTIELFAYNREHNFYSDFPRVVPTTTSFHPPLTFIARYAKKDLPTRRGWKKTKVHAPQVSVRNELAYPSDYLMCIEPQ